MLFEEAAAEYMDDKRRRRRQTTCEGYESAIRRHLMPRWRGVELEDIEPEDIQEWVDGIDLPGAAAKAYKTLRQIIRWSIRKLRLRMWDPTTAGVELPRRAPYEPRVLSAGQEKLLLTEIRGQEWEPVVLCAATLGLRRCEACALEWGDVDYRSGEIRITKGVHVVRGGEVTTPTKTAKSTRKLVLPFFALKRLRKLARGRRSGRMCKLKPNQVADRAKRYCRRMGLPWVGMQNLRHSFATIARANGAVLDDLVMQLGHSSYDTSFVHYITLTDDVCRRVTKTYADALLAA